MYHTFKDHQGSLAAVVHGNTVERLSHDTWGRRRNPVGFGYDNVSHTFDRGFTGHEHLSRFGLVNMDGRVYDPVMSCFLSPDLYVPGTADPRSYNRFAYCMHNPLRYVDPSGWRPRQPAPGSTPSTGDFIREIYAYSEKAYEPRDFGIHQLSTSDAIVVWMEENQLHGGGGFDHCSVFSGDETWCYYGYGDPNAVKVMGPGACLFASLGLVCKRLNHWDLDPLFWKEQEKCYYNEREKHGYNSDCVNDFIQWVGEKNNIDTCCRFEYIFSIK